MKNIKWFMIVGGTLLLIGIILKIAGITNLFTMLCFSIGGTLKLMYLIFGIRSGKLKYGYEVLFLLIGLGLIFSAMGAKQSVNWHLYYGKLLGIGIFFKTLFVVLFIRRQKKAIHTEEKAIS